MYKLPTEITPDMKGAEKKSIMAAALIDAIDPDIELVYKNDMIVTSGGERLAYVEMDWEGNVRIQTVGSRDSAFTLRNDKKFNSAVGSLKRKTIKIIKEIERKIAKEKLEIRKKAKMSEILTAAGLAYNPSDLDKSMRTDIHFDSDIGTLKTYIQHQIDDKCNYSATFGIGYKTINFEGLINLLPKITVEKTV